MLAKAIKLQKLKAMRRRLDGKEIGLTANGDGQAVNSNGRIERGRANPAGKYGICARLRELRLTGRKENRLSTFLFSDFIGEARRRTNATMAL